MMIPKGVKNVTAIRGPRSNFLGKWQLLFGQYLYKKRFVYKRSK